jgi:hypothetical protein
MTTTNITAALITGFTLPVLNSWRYWLPAALAGPLALGLCIVLYALVVRVLRAAEG